MIKNGKYFIELPGEWNKIIRALKKRPMDIYELRNKTNIDFERLKEILRIMKFLSMALYKDYRDEIKIIDKEAKNDKDY